MVRTRPTRRKTALRAALVLAGGVGLLAATLQPAAAATTPRQVGLVTFTGASYNATLRTAGLTIDWVNTRGAKKYQVFLSRSYSMSRAKTYKTTSSAKTFTGLVRGANYFVQVRGINGSKVGKKSARVGHTTIRTQSATAGPTYRVMTYNVCSDKCSGWATRKPAALGRVAAYNPDVIAFQEAKKDAFTRSDLPGYTQVAYSSAKQLYFRTSRFDIATTDADGATTDADDAETPRAGSITLGPGRYAVWGEAIDKTANNKHVIFVSVHTTPGKTSTAAKLRKAEITRLLATMKTINTDNLPVVYGGDFNSHKNRSDDYLASVFHSAGFYDGYDLARKLTRQHYNSYSTFGPRPVISVTWGDHVDHVWANPSRTRVLSWANGMALRNGLLVRAVPSDHSPVIVDLQVN